MAKSKTTGFDRLWPKWCPPSIHQPASAPKSVYCTKAAPCLQCLGPLLGGKTELKHWWTDTKCHQASINIVCLPLWVWFLMFITCKKVEKGRKIFKAHHSFFCRPETGLWTQHYHTNCAPPVEKQLYLEGPYCGERTKILHRFKPEGHTQCGSSLKETWFIVIGGKISSVVGFSVFKLYHTSLLKNTFRQVNNTENTKSVFMCKN